MSWVSLCEVSELREDTGKYVEMDGFQLAVFRIGENVFAIENTCPHAGGPLADGPVEGGCIVCPWHQWTFHLDSGELAGAPGVKIPTYKTRIFTRGDGTALVQADLPKY